MNTTPLSQLPQGRVRFAVSAQLVVHLLQLPHGTAIAGVQWDAEQDVVILDLRCLGLPIPAEGEPSPLLDGDAIRKGATKTLFAWSDDEHEKRT